MVIVWRGIGFAVPIALGIAAYVVSRYVGDARLGNLAFTGWTLVVAAGITVLPALYSLAVKKGKAWALHSFFFIPLVIWIPILGGGGALAVTSHNPVSAKVLGTWDFAGCINPCPGLHERLEGLQLVIEPDAVTAFGTRRTYEVLIDREPILRWRYHDNGEEEAMSVYDDRILGKVTDAGKDVPVRFNRVKE